MRNSLFHKFTFLVVLFTGISSLINGQSKTSGPGQGPQTWSVFDTAFEKALFKGTLDISKHHLSGLFFMKRTSPGSIRIMFSNEMGMTFFDVELKGDEFIIHSCFPSLNKASLMKMLHSDFRLLLIPATNIKYMKPLKSKDPGQVVFKVKYPKGAFRYTWDKESGRICRIQTLNAFFNKTDLLLEGNKGPAPKKISMSNPMIRLHIIMTYLSK
jgi:hypothetical protein